MENQSGPITLYFKITSPWTDAITQSTNIMRQTIQAPQLSWIGKTGLLAAKLVGIMSDACPSPKKDLCVI